MCQSIVFLSLSLSLSLLNTLYFILAQLGRANESIQLYLYMLKQHYSTLGTVNLALCLYSLIVIGVPFSDLSYERFYRQCVFQLLVVARLRRRGWRWQGGRRRRRLGVRGLLAEVGLVQFSPVQLYWYINAVGPFFASLLMNDDCLYFYQGRLTCTLYG